VKVNGWIAVVAGIINEMGVVNRFVIRSFNTEADVRLPTTADEKPNPSR
jgi:hypothetical protein